MMWNDMNAALKQSVSRMSASVANLMPGIVAFLLALLVATIVAWIARAALRRFLRSIQFDQRSRNLGFTEFADWFSTGGPSMLVANAVSWTIILLGLLVGITAFDSSLATALALRLFAYIPNVIAAILVIAVGTIVARVLARGVLISAVNMQVQSARLLSLGVKWLTMVMAGAMALNHLGIGGQIVTLSFCILFGGIVLALAMAVGLGSKDLVSRTLERQTRGQEEREAEEEFHHL
jgi:Conserved TM helix